MPPLKESEEREVKEHDNGRQTLERDVFNIFDGQHGRPDGIYLDIEERKHAEVVRAAHEGREPDLSDPGKLPPAVGTPFVVAEAVPDNRHTSNVSQITLAAREVDPVTTTDVEVKAADTDVDLSRAAQVANERRAQDESLAEAADNGDVDALAASDVTGSGDVTTEENPDAGAPGTTDQETDGTSDYPIGGIE